MILSKNFRMITRLFKIFVLLALVTYIIFLVLNARPTRVKYPAETIKSNLIELMVNTYRESLNLAPLEHDVTLCAIADRRAKEIKYNWAHPNMNLFTYYGQSIASRHFIGENLAKNWTSSYATVQAWLDSPSHLKNIVNIHYGRTCVVAYEDNYVVQIFSN